MASTAGVLGGSDSIPDSPEQAQAGASKTVKNPSISQDSHAAWKPRANPWLIAMTVALAAFMEVLDTSIANVALPHISGDLGASPDQGTWVLTSYLVANAIVLPLGGWASNTIGRKNFFMLCITIFTLASFLCGIAPSLPILLLCRVLQGAGGGGLQPMAQAIMADSFGRKETRAGVRSLRIGRSPRPLDRPLARWLDHRQLLLALDFLHQHSRRHPCTLSNLAHGRRSTVDQAGPQASLEHGLHRSRVPDSCHGWPSSHA